VNALPPPAFPPNLACEITHGGQHDRHGERSGIGKANAGFTECFGAAKLSDHGLAGILAGFGGFSDGLERVGKWQRGDLAGFGGSRGQGVDHGFITGLGSAAFHHAFKCCFEQKRQAFGIESGSSGQSFAPGAVNRAKESSAGTAHARHHGRAGGDEDLLHTGRIHGFQLRFHGLHAALHAETVITVTEIAISLGKHGFGGNDGISHLKHHETDLVRVEFHDRA
jgi:hypothetical protein